MRGGSYGRGRLARMSDLLGGPGRVPTGLLVAGWIFAFLLPIVGLIIGVIALAKGVTIQAYRPAGLPHYAPTEAPAR